jgi:CrcB protein
MPDLRYLALAIGGALGTVCRYGISIALARIFGAVVPAGTLAVNLTGCFLLGLVFGLGESRGLSPGFRLFFMTGFLGAYTTFSTFAVESVLAQEGGRAGLALGNVIANNLGGLVLAKLGLMLGRLV